MPSLVKTKDLDKLKQLILKRGHVDREHVLRFLTLIPTSEAEVIVREVKEWLESLHKDDELPKVNFPESTIKAILDDLESYKRIQSKTLLKLNEKIK